MDRNAITLPQIDSLTDYIRQRIDAISRNMNVAPPHNVDEARHYWNLIAANAETIKILAEALETEARKKLKNI